MEIEKYNKNVTLNKESKRQIICIYYQKHFTPKFKQTELKKKNLAANKNCLNHFK